MGTYRVKYFEHRRLASGSDGYLWSNRHAVKHGMQREWLGTDLAAALARAEYLNKLWDEVRRGKSEAKPGPARGSVAWLLDDIVRTKDHNERRWKIRREIERAFAIVAASPVRKAPVAAITGRDCKELHRKLKDAYGVSKAQRVMKWLRYALNVAVQQKLIAASPMAKMRIERPAPRQVWWSFDEVAAAARMAHQMGRASLALAIWLAYDLGWREGDIIDLKWSSITADHEVRVVQRKTGAERQVPLLPETLEELRSTAKVSTHLVVSEKTRRPYAESDFQHNMEDVLAAVGFTTGNPKVDKKFGDLRRSAVVRMDQAGCTTGEISSVTGHTEQSIVKIIATYRPPTTITARHAQAKVVAFNRSKS